MNMITNPIATRHATPAPAMDKTNLFCSKKLEFGDNTGLIVGVAVAGGNSSSRRPSNPSFTVVGLGAEEEGIELIGEGLTVEQRGKFNPTQYWRLDGLS
jgi:hypothetical protein